jgi:hypothetical protein
MGASLGYSAIIYFDDPNYWPPTDYYRSIYQYHAERQPWLAALRR